MIRLDTFYLKNDLMTGNTFFTFLMRYTVLLFRRFYFSHEKMCILNMNYFSYYSYTSSFAKYYQNATQRLIPLGENYELGLSNLTHLYTPILKTVRTVSFFPVREQR